MRVPPLEMVDDIAIVSKCGNDSIIANSVVNTFIESKKLNFSEKKCHQMHIGAAKITCPELNVHDTKMKKSNAEKYLGNTITEDGSNKTNTKNRIAKGYGIAAEILSIIKEIPFGTHQFEVALKLRESMLINGIFTNIEVCYGLTEKEIKDYEVLDEYLLRQILNGHSKTAIENLYLETGVIPSKYIIIS